VERERDLGLPLQRDVERDAAKELHDEEELPVIGLPDALRGEEVTAVIVLKTETTASERELIVFCRERLANYKVPRTILFREVLPRGGTGKVVKRLLKKELEMEPPA